MTEVNIRQLLESIPRASASAGFEDGVNAEAMRRAALRKSHRPLLAVVALAVAIIAGGTSHRFLVHRHEARLDRLRAEHAALAGEIEELKSQTPQSSVVNVSVDSRDVIIDLAAADSSRAQSAATYEY